ncbi:MAG: DNA ligase, partial [Gemmataceae bacterium]
MPDIPDGGTVEMQGSGSKPYLLKNTGGVYSCSCPAWRNQSVGIERRTCKHLRKYRGDAAEEARIGGALPAKPQKPDGAEDGADLPLLLAESWDGELDPTGWWMSEKLDGVRAYWDGTRFLSRLGNVYHAPAGATEGFPSFPFDGELFVGRGQFQATVTDMAPAETEHPENDGAEQGDGPPVEGSEDGSNVVTVDFGRKK